MANRLDNTDSALWGNSILNQAIASKAWSAVEREPQCEAREQVRVVQQDARNRVYRTAAPSLGAVAAKLHMLWEAALIEEDASASWKRMIIGDIRRLAMIAEGVSQDEASGRSGRRIQAAGEQWAAAARTYDEHEKILMEGPSEKWGSASAGDLVAVIDEAASELLTLPSPGVPGVIKKLNLLWEDDLFFEVDAPAYLAIVKDLNRLSRTGATAQV